MYFVYRYGYGWVYMAPIYMKVKDVDIFSVLSDLNLVVGMHVTWKKKCISLCTAYYF